MEKWKEIEGYEGHYEVSDQGRVRSLPRVQKNKRGQVRNYGGKLLGEEGFGYADKFGYRSVILCVNSKQVRYKIHRLVAYAFIRKLKDEDVVMHLNDVTSDNRAANLEIGSQSENIRDCITKGRFNSGVRNREKTHCPRGHLFKVENLRVADHRNGKRACLSCHRALTKVYDHKRRYGVDLSESIQEIADSYYDALEPVAPTVVQHINEQIAYAELGEERPAREAVLARRKRIGERHNKEHA